MTTTDTPRTDAVIQSPNSYFMVRVESLCRELERDLNASKAEVERLMEELSAETANREKCCRDGNAYADELWRKLKMTEDENEKLKAGKVFVDPKWIYDLETQLAKAHEELCQAGLREYGN